MTRNSLTCNELILLTFNNHNLHIKACRWKEFNVFYKLVLKILIFWISLSSLRFFVSKKRQTVLISAFRAAPATCFSLTFFSRCLDSSISMMALNPLCNSRSSVTFHCDFWSHVWIAAHQRNDQIHLITIQNWSPGLATKIWRPAWIKKTRNSFTCIKLIVLTIYYLYLQLLR